MSDRLDITAMLREWCEGDHDPNEFCVHCEAADETDRLRAALVKLTSHYVSEDCWYSCPLSVEGCCDERQSGCTCYASVAIEALGGIAP